jgi:LPXTG-site transpeptidase (sortase) family protein
MSSAYEIPQQFHRRINNALTIFVVLLGLYMVLSPFVPQFIWWISPPKAADQPQTLHVSSSQSTASITGDEVLSIPRLNMTQTIHTGASQSELNKGVWLIPKTSTPDKQSNTVLAGHRFTYTGPAVFYFLDKVQTDDKIYISWHNKEYAYQVRHIRVVPPTAMEIQAASKTPTLTIYTCTPLLTAKNRLVIVAELTGVRT